MVKPPFASLVQLYFFGHRSLTRILTGRRASSLCPRQQNVRQDFLSLPPIYLWKSFANLFALALKCFSFYFKITKRCFYLHIFISKFLWVYCTGCEMKEKGGLVYQFSSLLIPFYLFFFSFLFPFFWIFPISRRVKRKWKQGRNKTKEKSWAAIFRSRNEMACRRKRTSQQKGFPDYYTTHP